MRWAALAAILLGIAGCGGRNKPTPTPVPVPAPGGDGGTPTWVLIDLSTFEDEDDLDGIEIRKITADCGNLLDLEPAARLGRLSDDQIRCLDTSLSAAERQTAKDKINRVLLADAWAKGDTHRWMGVAARHLEEIDRSDPDLVYQFAFHIVQLGNPERMDEAIYWAGVALENKAAWEGDLHVRRVYALQKVRTTAAFRKWEYLEGQFKAASKDLPPGEPDKSRNDFKTLAREWYEFAKVSGRDPGEALRMCAMAAGTESFCTEG